MPRRMFTGLGRGVFVTAMAGAAPTVAEIGAGVDLTGGMLRTGLTTPNTGQTIDASDAGSRFNKTQLGTRGGDAAELSSHRESKSSEDVAWNTLVDETEGWLIVSRFGWDQDAGTGLGTADGTPTAGDRIEVYPVAVISREMAPIGDETSRFVARLAITDEPDLDAVVLA